MFDKFIYCISFILIIFLVRFNFEPTVIRDVCEYNILFIVLFLWFLSNGKKFSFLSPLNIFGVSFFIHLIFGQLVWILREVFLFNNDGKPLVISRYYLMAACIFLLLSHLKRRKYNCYKLVENIVIKFEFPVFLSIGFIIVLTYLGVYLYTSGFKIIPIFSNNIDEARFALMQEKGSRGLGSVLLLTGIHSIFKLRYTKIGRIAKIILYFILFVPYFFYGGRLLLILPFIVLFLPFIYKIKYSFINVVKGFLATICFLFIVNYFGTIRQFGSFSFQSFILYSWSDSFNEFQNSAHALANGKPNFGDEFIPSFFSSFLPSSLFTLFDENKDSYYKPIGYIVNQNTIFYKSPEVGIRLSLFGEIFMCNPLLIVTIMIFIFYLVSKVDTIFTDYIEWTFNKYLATLIGVFLAISIPYGISFISMASQFLLLSYFLFSFKFKRQL